MRARTPSEVRAYADGYNACYKEFYECLKNRCDSVHEAVEMMKLFVTVVNNCIEVAEQSEPNKSEIPTGSKPQTEREGK